MRSIRLTIYILSFLLCAETVQAEPLKKEILILHSYNEGMAWTDSIMEGITDVFKHEDVDTNIYVDYMDTKRYSPELIFKLFYEFLSKKYSNNIFDLIIVSDDNAYQFMLRHGDTLFPEVPVVFCGVNYFDRNQIAAKENYTGIIENVAAIETLNTALELHPETDYIYVVDDQTTTGRALKKLLQNELHRIGKNLPVHFLESLTLTELQDQLEVLPPNSLILLLSFNRDSSGQTFSYKEAISLIAPHANAPMYGVWKFYLGRGIVGGKITWGRTHGKAAALMGQSILQGTPAKEMPVRSEIGSTYMFDYQMLKKYDIPRSRLPAGSIIVNEPDNVFHQYKIYILSTLGIVLGLSVFSAFLGINILQRKKVEEKIRENAKLKSDFVTTAAHEFRTPLTSIQGYSELMLMREDITREQRAEFLTYIHERSRALAKIVADLLDMGRFEAGQEIPMAPSIISISAFIEQLKSNIATLVAKHRLEFAIEGSETQLHIDKYKINQVFENLISNAAKYSSPGTKIKAEGKRIEGDQYQFSIIDHGNGMTPEQLQKIFDKFYRADASDTALGGIGLGMSISKQIIESHGGKITVKSSINAGTTVDFTLPVVRTSRRKA